MRLAKPAALMLAAGLWPATLVAAPGNAWHLPSTAEPGIASMRDPTLAPAASGVLRVYSGNQFQGAGNPGNQLQTGSAVRARRVGEPAWTEFPLSFHSQSGNNIYYEAVVPAGTYGDGDVVEYYLRIPYSDHDTTYVFGSDGASTATATEAAAVADPFVVSVRWPPAPQGAFAARTFGDIEARVYESTGHLQIVGPDLGGRAGANVLDFLPPQARIDDEWVTFGAVIDTTEVGDALEIRQALGNRVVTSRLSQRSEGVIRYEVTDWGGPAPQNTSLIGVSPSDEHFYGFGEKFNTFDQAGNRVRVLTADPPGDKGDQSYKVAPWFLSTRGYGMHLDSEAESVFDMRAADPDRYAITNLDSTLAFNIVYGPRLTDVLERYTDYTGRPPLPPPFAFGPWMSSDHWRDGGEVRYVVSKYVEEGIPGSVFVFDSPWETAYNDFNWNMTQFSRSGTYEGQSYDGFGSVSEMMGFLRAHGFKVVVWMTPFLNVSSFDEGVPGQNTGVAGNYAEAQAQGYLVRDGAGGPPIVVDWWKGQGTPVDFTNEGARQWFRAQLRDLVTESGDVIGGFKIDDGEGDFIPLAATYSDGRTGLHMRNAYTVEYHETVYDVLGQDGILFSRSGFVGTHAYPGCWAGDNEPNFGAENGLPTVIIAGQSAAMSGYSIWGHDIGGYQDANLSSTPENLFMRWTQLGAFSPLMQMHRQVGLDLIYPWSFGPDGLDNYRKFARLHTQLFPYIYSMAKASADRGVPIIRPLVLEYQDDANTWDVQHTYSFGDSLLVAPMVTNEQTERRVYLPQGGWVDFWTHERFEGGQFVDWLGEDQSEFPLFMREGAIIPTLTRDVQTIADAAYVGDPAIATPDGAWTVWIVPGAEPSSLVAYEDTRIDVDDGPTAITIDLDGAARDLELEVLTAAPMSVTVGGNALLAQPDRAALDAVATGWTTDADLVVVKFPHLGGATQIQLHRDPVGGTGSGDGATSTAGDSTAGDAGAEAGADGGSDSSGCGCRTSDRDATTAGFALLLLLTIRRRRGADQ